VAKSDQPEIIGLLSIALADNNRELVLSALRAATKLGPLAGSLRDQLQELAETTRDGEIKTAAADAVLSAAFRNYGNVWRRGFEDNLSSAIPRLS
jgi:hypothetical protein